jgi:hypothetical protein
VSGSDPNGSWAAYSPTGLAGSGTLMESTTTKWITGDSYTLTFDLGVPNTEPDGTTAVSGAPVGAIRVYFLEDGVNASLPAYDLTAPSKGQWEQVQLTVSAAQLASASAAGHNIGVEFFVSTTGNNQEVNFDAAPASSSNLSAVPEPVSVALFGTAIALCLHGIRRKFARAS